MNRIKNLENNPFSKMSAEEEIDFIDEIFYKPRYYDELIGLFTSGISRFIIGKRGQGKSMLIHNLLNDLKDLNILSILITRYDEIPLEKNENHFLYSIMQSLTIELSKFLLKNPEEYKKLSKNEKNRFSFFIELFYKEKWNSEFIEYAKIIKKRKSTNLLKRIFNKTFLKLVNSTINGTVLITSQFIRQSIGLPEPESTLSSIEYIKELPEKPINHLSIDEVSSWDRSTLINMLNFLIKTSETLGFKSIAILFDKIDEFQAINGDVEKITDFSYEILTDTDLLLSNNISIIFSLWSEVKKSLNKRGVRFDKFKEVDTVWRKDELPKIINKRLYHFSIDKSNPVTFETIIPNSNDRNTIIDLAENSPRALIRLLGDVYNEDTGKINLESFSSDAVSRGIKHFCLNFDYISQRPSKMGARNDLNHWINRLLRIRKFTFTINDMNSTFSQRDNISNKHIETLRKVELIKESLYLENGEIKQYEIIDTRIKYLIKLGVLDIDER